MTQEEKQLLLQDLCARLPYGVMCEYKNEVNSTIKPKLLVDVCRVKTEDGFVYWDCYFEDNEGQDIPVEIVKPYLRPMKSMTEEEEREVRILWNEDFADKISLYHCYPKTTDFYLSHHLDFRGLIPMGLAIEAPEGMYETKQ